MIKQDLPAQVQTSSSVVTNEVQQASVNTGAIEVLQDVRSVAKGTVLQEFYRDTNILVTGATGFIGKVLVEKLLRACPGIKRIYLIIRNKKGKSMEESLEEVINIPLFDRLRREYPKFQSKLHIIPGDLALMGLGIGDEDRRLLCEQLHVIFHVAATVRYDEKLSVAVTMNVRGTRELLSLARDCKNLKSFVHVSTAYCNICEFETEEYIYPPPMPSDLAIKTVESADPHIIDTMTLKFLGKWPNTYVYTKLLSEDIVKTCGQDLPVGVHRPSVVVSTYMEPVSGWVDNMYGLTGVILGAVLGLIRCIRLDVQKEANIVPCDLVVNSMIASAWDIAENRTSDIPVYNYVSPRENKITWTTYINTCTDYRMCFSTQALWYPKVFITGIKPLAALYRILLHYLPALIIDLCRFIGGKKIKMFSLYKKIHKLIDVSPEFNGRTYIFKYNNIDILWKKLKPEDQQLFNFDIKGLNWLHFMDRSCRNLRLYLLKEGPETSRAAMGRFYWLKLFHFATTFLLFILSMWLLWTILNTVGPRITRFLNVW